MLGSDCPAAFAADRYLDRGGYDGELVCAIARDATPIVADRTEPPASLPAAGLSETAVAAVLRRAIRAPRGDRSVELPPGEAVRCVGACLDRAQSGPGPEPRAGPPAGVQDGRCGDDVRLP